MSTQSHARATTLSAADVIGPFSRWPRQKQKRPIRAYAAAGTTFAAAALFVHCVAPLL